MTTAPHVVLYSADPALRQAVSVAAAVTGVEVVAGGDHHVSMGASTPVTVLVGVDAVDRWSGAPSTGGAPRLAVAVGSPAAGDEVAWRRAAARAGCADLLVLPADRDLLLAALRPVRAAAGGARVIVVRPGCGGAGASTLVAAVLRRAARLGHRVVGVDLDLHGPGLDLVLGMDTRPGIRWSDVTGLTAPPHPAALADSLPSARGVAVVSYDARRRPMSSAPVAAVISACVAAYDVVVVDAPGTTADVLPRGAAVDLDLVVVSTGVPAAAAAVARSRDSGHAVGAAATGLAVRRVPGASVRPADLAAVLDRPLVAVVRHDRRLAAALDRGDGPGLGRRGPWVRAADDVLRGAGIGVRRRGTR